MEQSPWGRTIKIGLVTKYHDNKLDYHSRDLFGDTGKLTQSDYLVDAHAVAVEAGGGVVLTGARTICSAWPVATGRLSSSL